MTTVAKSVILARRPGQMISAEDFAVVETPLAEPGAGEILVRNLCMSVDPYMRLPLSDRPGFPALKPVGDVMTGGAVGVVELSNAPEFAVGDLVTSQNGWRDYFVVSASTVQPVRVKHVPPSWHLGVLGLTGLTAFVGIEYILQPKAGDTVFVSGVAGAVGSVAAQLAKRRGCKVLGTAGSADKIEWAQSVLGVDAVANYKSADLMEFLAAHAPDGVASYFDNVGGPTLDAAILSMQAQGKIVICGAISQYNEVNFCAGPQQFFKISEKGLSLTGLNVGQWYARAPEILPVLADMLHKGELVWEETVVDGLEQAASAFVSLFSGANRGKMIIKLGDLAA